MRRVATVLAAAVILVSVSVSPAAAAIEKSGTKYCPAYATAKANYFGTVWLKGPGDSTYSSAYSSPWAYHYNQGNPDGYWRAYISPTGGLNHSNTYAWCHSGG